jgi:hypothetical protein
MNRSVSAQISYDRLNKGVDIRNPSTAAFLIDSADAPPSQSAAQFTITPPGQNLLSGFFTRFAVTEIVLNWGICNISPQTGLNTVTFNYNGIVYTATLQTGFYNVQTALDALVLAMNAAVPGNPFTVADSQAFIGVKRIIAAISFYFINTTTANQLPNALGFPTYGAPGGLAVPPSAANSAECVAPNLQPYSYLDFTSAQLAAHQDVKDSGTQQSTPDSFYRWVFSDSDGSTTTYDNYGYPILQGYKQFQQRRYLSFPKQIRWDPLSPIGQIQFNVVTNDGELLEYGFQNEFAVNTGISPSYGQKFSWNALMLVSEV